jgi:hypothetical protein
MSEAASTEIITARDKGRFGEGAVEMGALSDIAGSVREVLFFLKFKGRTSARCPAGPLRNFVVAASKFGMTRDYRAEV